LVLGFVAGAVVLGPREPEEDEAGMIVYFPMLALLAVSLVSWAMIGPTRSLAQDGGFLGASLEAAFVLLFVSGIQGLLFNLLPITFLDGQKVWRWNPLAWLSIAVPSAFIFFHVIVNRSGTFASATGERSIQMLIAVCAIFWVLTVGAWVFFRIRKAREARERDFIEV
jgi:Zn-dependent protease